MQSRFWRRASLHRNDDPTQGRIVARPPLRGDDGRFHHVAATCDGRALRLYVRCDSTATACGTRAGHPATGTGAATTAPHDSGPVWVAIPSLYDSLSHSLHTAGLAGAREARS